MTPRQKIVLTTLTLLISFTALGQTQRGKASFYSKKMTGHKTANGERLHHDSLTCAHKTYPFGTLLRVTNPANGNQVIVRVTDRGPYVKGRIIDLSVRAAHELGIIGQGIAPVIVERYTPANIPFKPENVFEVPELELGANDGPITKPIWMELRDQEKKRIQEKLEAEAKAKEMTPVNPLIPLTPETTVSTTAVPEKKATKDDALKEINNTPNHSKAYMKRQGGQPVRQTKRR